MSNVVFLVLRRLRGPLVTLICVYAISVLGLVLIPGVDGQGRPWRMDFFHAFYFVSFMGSTIGFGEIPYPFTPAQRFWVLVCIYTSVFAWLYAIGRMLALLQDPAFRYAVTYSAFVRSVRRIVEPFYLICGYGDTGQALARRLTDRGIRVVVIDHNQDQVNALELEGLPIYVPGLRADASHPEFLMSGGLKHPRCAGVIAVTNQDQVNLKIAITTKLVNPDLAVIARSELHDVGVNMESFGTDHIINPFDIFADRLASALHSPASYLIHEWLTSAVGTPLREPLFPPKGRWVLCGYGRFGKAVEQFLSFEGVEATIIEAEPDLTAAPEGSIRGRGTEAVTLREGGIEQAVGVIAGTDDDANNLSIVMTAKELRPQLFTVARQNRQENDAIFEAAGLDMIMKRSEIIARRITTLIVNPMLAEFLELRPTEDEEWANVLAARIGAVSGDTVPATWVLNVSKSKAPALAIALFRGRTVTVGHLLRSPEDVGGTLPCLPLMRKHGNETTVLPGPETPLQLGDRVLFCGQRTAEWQMLWSANNRSALGEILSDDAANRFASNGTVTAAE